MKLTIEIRDEDAALESRCSHGPLNMKRPASMLLEDVALAVRRPGSWEGANMLRVLQAHGYLL